MDYDRSATQVAAVNRAYERAVQEHSSPDERDIPREFKVLQVAVEELEKSIAELQGRAHNILRFEAVAGPGPDGPHPGMAPSPCCSPLGASIWELRQKVNLLIETVQRIADRMQL